MKSFLTSPYLAIKGNINVFSKRGSNSQPRHSSHFGNARDCTHFMQAPTTTVQIHDPVFVPFGWTVPAVPGYSSFGIAILGTRRCSLTSSTVPSHRAVAKNLL